VLSPEVLEDFDDVLDPPPHEASETAASAAAATDMIGVMRLVRVTFAPSWGTRPFWALSGVALEGLRRLAIAAR
jgi:hypothetical protein